MSLTCTYTTTSSDTPVTVTYDTYSDLKTNLTQNSSYKTILKTVTLSGSGTDTDATMLFYACSALTTVDLSNLDTSNVTNMSGMFTYCSSLTSLDVSNFETSNVTNMRSMFFNCLSLTSLDVSNFETSNVTNMSEMFFHCSSLTSLDVSNFNTSNVTNISHMFRSCNELITIYCDDDWNTSTVTTSTNMFNGCTSLVGAISYDSSKTDANYANHTTGYFTPVSPIISSSTTFATLTIPNFSNGNILIKCGYVDILNSQQNLIARYTLNRQAPGEYMVKIPFVIYKNENRIWLRSVLKDEYGTETYGQIETYLVE